MKLKQARKVALHLPDCATWRQALSQQTTKLRTIDIAF
jgi:hypothetical protein